MTRDDVIAMAREADIERDGDLFYSMNSLQMDVDIADLERFASLVEQRTIERCAAEAEVRANRFHKESPFFAELYEAVDAIRALGGE